jgi:hypothetical protein
MAKQGLNYYSVDTDRYADRKIKRLKHSFGCSGLAVYDYLLCEVYRDRGCGLVWDEDTAFDVADYFGLKVTTVKEIVRYCGAVGLFNSELLTGGIITSEAIQQRYLEMCNRAKRPNVTIPEEWRLIPEKTEKFPKIPEKTENITEEFHKVNKSKVKEINKFISNNAQAHVCTCEEKQRILEIFYFDKNFVNPHDELDRFVNHYDANGWCRNGSNVPIKDKRALARSWKPLQSGAHFPKYFIEWLYLVYAQALEREPAEAKNIMQLDKFDMVGDKHICLYCSQDVANVIERNVIPTKEFQLKYRIAI